jgi:hypothetical protein
MDVAITPNEAYQGVTTHLELSEAAFMSNLAQVNKKIYFQILHKISFSGTHEKF